MQIEINQIAIYVISGLVLAYLNDISKTNRAVWKAIAEANARAARMQQQIDDHEKNGNHGE